MEINLEEIKSEFLNHYIEFVFNFLSEIVQKIDYCENVLQIDTCHYDFSDKRYFKNIWCDQDYIIIDLLDSVDLTDMPEVK